MALGEPSATLQRSTAAYLPASFLMAFYRIEILSNGEWTDDASLLGHGLSQSDNEFNSDLDAINAIDELVELGFRRDDLRFVEID